MIPQSTLILDIETSTNGGSMQEKELHTLRFFGAYSYKYNQYFFLDKLEVDKIQKLISEHRFLVGFNNLDYDNFVLNNCGFDLNYKLNIDLLKGIMQRATMIKFKNSILAYHLPTYSLDDVTKTLGLANDDDGKMKIDYELFNKETLTHDEYELCKEYTLKDIEITKKLFEWWFQLFDDWGHHLNEDDRNKLKHLSCSPSVYTYKVICNRTGMKEEYSENKTYSNLTDGAFVAFPAGEKFEGNIYCLDFACLPTGTKIRCGYKNNSNRFDKNIEKLKVGDIVVNEDGIQEIGAIREQNYNGELIEFELENGMIMSCTPNHKIPIIRDGYELVIEAQSILETDELITTNSKYKSKNPNYKDAKKIYQCEVCGFEYEKHQSESKKTCSKECAKTLKSINSFKSNLGKTKYNTKHLMRLSLERTGVPRSEKTKQKISQAVKKKMQQTDIRNRFLKANKNRDMSFMNEVSWFHKCALSRQKSIQDGKFTYKGIKMRSNWEVKVAKNLDKNNIKWKYEPDFIQLDDGSFYCPDFYLTELDKWIEVKGYMYDHSRKKIQQFQKENDLILLSELNDIDDDTISWLK